MKRIRPLIVIIAMAVMLIGSTLTTHAAVTGARATRYGLTTTDGTYIAYNDMQVSSGYASILSNYQTDTYATYKDYALYHYANETEENYVAIFVAEGQSVMYSPMVIGDKYYPRLSGTNSLFIVFNVKHDLAADTWTVHPSSSAPYQADTTFYGEYDVTIQEHSETWMRNAICYTTADILKNDKTTVFFKAPKSILVPIAEKAEMQGATAEIMKILPIGLACLVGYLALRKGLSILQGILHQA